MNKNWLLGALTAVLVPGLVWAGSTQFAASPSTIINCESGGGCQITIQGGMVSAESEQTFGSAAGDTTNWTAGNFTGDLRVGGFFGVSGTAAFAGAVSGIPKVESATITTSVTSTACTFLNSSAVNRTIIATSVIDRGTATSLGSVTWQAGTSTANGANGSSAIVFTKGINTAITRTLGDVITTTSTPQLSAYYQWKPGEYFNFLSGTTTNAGTCLIQYY